MDALPRQALIAVPNLDGHSCVRFLPSNPFMSSGPWQQAASAARRAAVVDPPLPSISIVMGLGAFLLGLGATPFVLSSAFVLPAGEHNLQCTAGPLYMRSGTGINQPSIPYELAQKG